MENEIKKIEQILNKPNPVLIGLLGYFPFDCACGKTTRLHISGKYTCTCGRQIKWDKNTKTITDSFKMIITNG